MRIVPCCCRGTVLSSFLQSEMSAFALSDQGALIGVVAASALALALLVRAACAPAARPAQVASARDFSAEAGSAMPSKVLVCHACNVQLTVTAPSASDDVAKHRAGKKHRKAAGEEAGEGAFAWEPAVAWARAAGADELAFDDGVRVITAEEAAARKRSTTTVAAPVAAPEAGGGGGGWSRVKAGSGSGKDSGSGAGGKDVLAAMCHVEGHTNILEGFVVAQRFLTAGSEAQLLAFIDTQISAGQSGRLRGSTYSAPRSIPGTSAPGVAPLDSPAVLSYGCLADMLDGQAPVGGKTVEPLPPALADIARRISGRGEWLAGAPRGSNAPVPDSASIVELRAGQFIAPHTLHPGFDAPVYVLALGGSPDALLGLRIDRIAGARLGDYVSSFLLRFERRSMLCLRGPSAMQTRFAVPCVEERTLLVFLRCMGHELRQEAQARGNC